MGKRATTFEELVPLVELCRAGKLFEVQEWIGGGNPVNPPDGHYRGSRKKVPLEYAIDAGFHSLVKVLLEGGTEIGPIDGYCPMRLALEKRRLDLAELLVDHGYDPNAVDMPSVFATWDPAIMEYFVDAGCDFDTDNPMAWALCNRIRTALPLVKKYRDKFPSFPEQANIALRHHCQDGNAKWVSLLLWAGADPLAPGEAEPDRDPDPEDGGLSALGFAALGGHYDLFGNKGMKAYLGRPEVASILSYFSGEESTPHLAEILRRGLNPNDQENGGCSAIQRSLERFCWYGHSRFRFDFLHREQPDRGLDSDRSREFMKQIHLLAQAGGLWKPSPDDIKSARKSLMKMLPEYTVEFIDLMTRYRAASRADLEELIRTPTIKKLVGKYRRRINERLESLEADEAIGANSQRDADLLPAGQDDEARTSNG